MLVGKQFKRYSFAVVELQVVCGSCYFIGNQSTIPIQSLDFWIKDFLFGVWSWQFFFLCRKFLGCQRIRSKSDSDIKYLILLEISIIIFKYCNVNSLIYKILHNKLKSAATQNISADVSCFCFYIPNQTYTQKYQLMSAVLFLPTKPNILYISDTKHQHSAKWLTRIFMYTYTKKTQFLF